MSKRIKIISMLTVLVFAITAVISISFVSTEKIEIATTNVKNNNWENKISDFSEGKQLMESKCDLCHGIKASHDATIAPPFKHIQSKYNFIHKTEQEFIDAIVSFTQNPSEETAIMYGALKQFKVMPNLAYTKEDAAKIAAYIYHGEFEKPSWHQ